MTDHQRAQLEEITEIVGRHLQGDYSDSLTRFSYLNGGAESFIRLTQNPDYTGYEREISLLEQVMPQLVDLVDGDLQVVDLGVGDGRKLNQVLLNLQDQIEAEYLGIDLSPAMIEIARANNPLGRDYAVCDFSDVEELSLELSQLGDGNRAIFMLGNTLTNEVDVEGFLRSLREASCDRSYLIVGLELFENNAEEIVREYRNEENYDLTFRPLEMIGIERSSGEIDIDYHPENQRIEEWYTFNENGQVGEVEYHEGDRVLLSVTYKPTSSEVRDMFSRSGWNEEAYFVDRSNAMILLSTQD